MVELCEGLFKQCFMGSVIDIYTSLSLKIVTHDKMVMQITRKHVQRCNVPADKYGRYLKRYFIIAGFYVTKVNIIWINNYSEIKMSIVNYTIISNKGINILYEEEAKSGTVF